MPLRTSPEKQELKKNIARADRIYCRYGDFIYAVIRSNVRDRALAEDIYQDFFLYLTARPLPEKLDSERAFIYKMLLDRIKDAFRTSGRYRARLDRYAEIKKIKQIKTKDSGAKQGIFEKAGRFLTAREKEAVFLHYRESCTLAEAAERMGIRTRSVSKHLSSGLRKLRKQSPETYNERE